MTGIVKGQESQANTLPSVTAEEIQGLTSNPKKCIFRGRRKCIDSVYLSVVWKHLQSGLQCSAVEADIFSGIPRDGKQNRYELRDWDGTGKIFIGSGRDRE